MMARPQCGASVYCAVCWVSAVCYLAVQAHPAAVESVFTEPGGPTQVVFPRGGIDHLQALVSHCPVHTEVGCFSRLTSLCVTYSCRTWKHGRFQFTGYVNENENPFHRTNYKKKSYHPEWVSALLVYCTLNHILQKIRKDRHTGSPP